MLSSIKVCYSLLSTASESVPTSFVNVAASFNGDGLDWIKCEGYHAVFVECENCMQLSSLLNIN